MSIWNFILSKLADGKRVILLVNVFHRGSSPGRQGFKMALAADNDSFGTIGGGVMEFDMLNFALNRFTLSVQPPELKSLVHRTSSPNTSGLICAGEQVIAVVEIQSSDRLVIEQIKDTARKLKKGSVVFSPHGISYSNKVPESGKAYKFSGVEKNGQWHYRELIVRQPLIFIFGAGHVGIAVTKAFQLLQYPVVVFDERKGFPKAALTEENQADGFRVFHEYHKIRQLFKSHYFTAAIVCSNAFDADIRALQTILPHRWNYIGLMGSTTKIKTIKKSLLSLGISEDQIATVCSPFGLIPHTHTPEEIAISVSAQVLGMFRVFEQRTN